MMWTERRLIELFKIEHPIVQAPMAGFATPELAAAVCEAGGLGSAGCATSPPDAAAKTIGELRRLTRRPINVNFFCHVPAKADAGREQAWREHLAPYYRELGLEQTPLPRLEIAPFGDAMCAVVEDTRPEVVSFHFGLPTAVLLARVKAAGCRVMSSATTVEEAIWLEAHGADVVIAQGAEAGGHRGTFLARDLNRAMASQCGTLALVPQIADAVRVPVIAAGGIADGRGIAAAFALGASGVQMGTAFLRCPEAATSPMHRDALKHARDDETLLTNVFTGRPARVIASRFPRELGLLSDATPDFPLPMGELPPLRAKAEQEQRRDFSPLWSGQAARLGTELPAKALVRKLAQDAIGCFAQLAGKVS
jgi:nitronate monooxygenase